MSFSLFFFVFASPNTPCDQGIRVPVGPEKVMEIFGCTDLVYDTRYPTQLILGTVRTCYYVLRSMEEFFILLGGDFPLQSCWSLSCGHGLHCSHELMWEHGRCTQQVLGWLFGYTYVRCMVYMLTYIISYVTRMYAIRTLQIWLLCRDWCVDVYRLT